MELKLYEYNVSSNINEFDLVNIQLLNNCITMNGNIIEDEDKINAITNLLENYKIEIIKLTSERVPNYKGGRQAGLDVIFETNGEIYKIIGNTPSQEMAEFYYKIKSEIIKIIEQ